MKGKQQHIHEHDYFVNNNVSKRKRESESNCGLSVYMRGMTWWIAFALSFVHIWYLHFGVLLLLCNFFFVQLSPLLFSCCALHL